MKKIKHAEFCDSNTVILYEEDGTSFKFENVIWVLVSKDFIEVEWVNSGPSGPWGRYIVADFVGVKLPDGAIKREGVYRTGLSDPNAILLRPK